jgi:hypothetical protein
VINSDIRRDSVETSEKAGKPRDAIEFPGVAGGGRWSAEIYFHLLNCGLRIPPTAGSGSGEVGNPLGYNRVYAHVEGDFSYEAWWNAVRSGRLTITNGPLLRPTVGGELPGHVFQADAAQQIELEIGLTLSTRDPISYIEVIKDARVVQSVRIKEFAEAGGRLPPVRFQRSGWLVIRAVTDVEHTYRYAMTAPYYVQIGGAPRISKASAQFFLDWAQKRADQLKLPEAQRAPALDYWRDLVARANTD